ncbi:glucose PTS transporter subunit EIIB [Buchananella hordeovulneris]|uniref:glucose PTS transporter subunit EIIB n=1 Tax=Buchananella hordeovulneris TaxID=52770 RepID=UPI000F5E0643|nr:PTS glucose/sucrose transporter subunit IIB [Buchananella hordeovulneris]RRD44983.1 PTS sugar transporter [Buchananella hordeovulneris]RRD53394.1 PTS sugar transporter [Buchananella hordeovulneris]
MNQAEKILKALGGPDNILDIEPCITRLRVELEDGDVVDEALLKDAGAHGVMRMGDIVQVVVGPNADTIAEDIKDLS